MCALVNIYESTRQQTQPIRNLNIFGHKTRHIKTPVNFFYTIFLLCVALNVNKATAQGGFVAPKDSSVANPMANQKDLTDELHLLFKKKVQERKDSAGAVHKALLPAAGYALQTGFAVVLSGNLGFYLGKNHAEEKISSITTSITYSQYSQIIFPIQADIWSKNGKTNIISDIRYLKYPSETFGLGGHSNINNGYNIDFEYIKLHQTILKEITKNLYGGIGYYFDYFWKVREIDVPTGTVTEFQRYGLTPTVKASGYVLRLMHDSRLNQINPANGWYGNAIFRSNSTFLGSDNNWKSLQLEARTYLKFPNNSKNILAFWSYNLLTLNGKPPYLLLPSTGWDDFYNTGRGYIQGRYRGNNMLYLESEYRFGITRNGLIGGVVFLNAESFPREISKEFSQKELSVIAPGYGVGLRVKLNKFSGTNLCIDYGFGIQGSKGISVNLGEVF